MPLLESARVRKRVKPDLLTHPQPSSECAGSGFIPAWGVAERYLVAGGILQEAEGPSSWRAYNPFAEYELPTQLARIATGELSPEEFAGRFGLLGYDRLLRPTQIARALAGDVSVTELSKQLSRDDAKRKGGDPVEWILAHSRTVGLCLDLIGAFEGGDNYLIVETVETVARGGQAARGPYAWGLIVAGLPDKFTKHTLKIHPQGHAAIARGWLSNFITDNIAGIRRRLQEDAYGSRLASYFGFGAMIQTVYWQLADTIERGGIRRCRSCQRFFLARDKRQQYCPPFPGATRSRCSSRLNVGNFRMRQR